MDCSTTPRAPDRPGVGLLLALAVCAILTLLVLAPGHWRKLAIR